MKLLILSVSAGNGHVRAAQALESTARLLPAVTEVVHLDAMDYVAKAFRTAYTDWYIKLVNSHPAVWTQLHRLSDTTPHDAFSQRLRRGMERLSSTALLRAVHNHKADAIVCTHFLPAELLMREQVRGQSTAPVWLQVTDYDLHNMWLVPGMAGYFAATPEVAHRMRMRGLPADRVHVTGIPVMPQFSDAASAGGRNAVVAALGLDPARATVLMASGGAGMGDLPTMVEGVLALAGDFQVIAVAGRNQAAHQQLDTLALAHSGRLLSIGFTQEMHRLMVASDVVVTKPGGLTVSECLALGRPMLLVSPIPGQEEHNAGYLMEEGAAWLAYDRIGLHYKIARLMAEPELLSAMAARSREIGRPRAAHQVLAQVLAPQRAAAETA